MKKTSFTDEQLLNLVNNTAIKYDRNPDDFTGGSIQITTAYRHKVVNHKVILFFGYTESRNPTSISFEIHEDLIFIWADAIKVKVASMKALISCDHISELNELMSEPKEKEKRTKKEKEISNIVVSRSRARTNHRTNVRTNNYLPDWLDKEAWNEWIAYRKEIRKKITPSVESKQIKFLEKHKDNHKEIIEQSIRNGWTGLFELKNDHGNGHKPESIKELKAYLKQFAAEGKNSGWSTMFEGREIKIDNSGRPYDAETIDDLDFDKAGRFYVWLLKNLESLEGKK